MFERRPPIAPPRRDGFTLIELLVVIGITGALIGVLLPTLAVARKASTQVVCMANLREWAMAARLHANANHGYLPRRGQGVQPTLQITRADDWFNALPPVVKQAAYSDLATANVIARPGNSRSIWICPAALDKDGANYWSYGMNMGLSVEQQSQNSGMPDRINVGNGSTMVFMADGPGNYAAVFPSKTVNGYNPVARHKGAVNIAFLDGHVAAFEGKYVGVGIGLPSPERFDVRWHPPGSTWNSAQ